MADEYNPWVELIKWSNEEGDTPTRRWNGFQLFWAEESGDTGLSLKMRAGMYRKGGKPIKRLSQEELKVAKSFFGVEWDFSCIMRMERTQEERTHIAVSQDIDFSYVHFDFEVDFSDTVFFNKVIFVNTFFATIDVPFGNDVNFKNAAFLRSVTFRNATFSGVSKFANVVFCADVSFEDANFLSDASFENSTFFGEASFKFTRFSAFAYINGVSFSANVSFLHTTFLFESWFEKSTFTKDACFQYATFSSDARFQNTAFLAATEFEYANFLGEAYFSCTENQTICDITFREATFQYAPPEFYGRTLPQATDLDFKFLPPFPLYKDGIKNHINAYERLRIQAEKLGMAEARTRFITHEMACRTAVCGNKYEKILRKAYEFFSDYGTSIWRPLLSLLVFWAVIFGIWEDYSTLLDHAAFTLTDAFIFSLGKMLPFVGSSSYLDPATVQVISDAPPYYKIPTTLFSIASLALLFLLGLGLRSKFRVGI